MAFKDVLVKAYLFMQNLSFYAKEFCLEGKEQHVRRTRCRLLHGGISCIIAKAQYTFSGKEQEWKRFWSAY